MDSATKQWVRRGNGTLATGGGYEGTAVYDPTTNRYYFIPENFGSRTNMEYWNPTTNTISTTGSFTSPSGTGSTSSHSAFIDDELRVMFWCYSPLMFAMDLNTMTGWTQLSGSWPESGSRWIKHNGAWWYKAANSGNTLHKLTLGANPIGGTWNLSTVNIGGSGLPSTQSSGIHTHRLMSVPVLDCLAWAYDCRVNNGMAIIKV